MSKTMRVLATALAGAAVAGGVATAPALAADDGPVLVNGVQRSQAELHKLTAHHKLFVVGASKPGKATIAFTHKSQFRAYVLKHLGTDVNQAGKKPPATAKASWAGDNADFYENYDGFGQRLTQNSGYGIADLHSVNCFLFWCSNFNDMISSVYSHGVTAILYSETNYRGSAFVAPPNQKVNIPWWFNDYASSLWVNWSY